MYTPVQDGNTSTTGKPIVFHGVTEEKSLTVALLNTWFTGEAGGKVQEANSTLSCKDWGMGAQPTQVSCHVIPEPVEIISPELENKQEQEEFVRQQCKDQGTAGCPQPEGKEGCQQEHGDIPAQGYWGRSGVRHSKGERKMREERPEGDAIVFLSLQWLPRLHLRRPLSWLATAGTWTRGMLHSKADPVATVTLDTIAIFLQKVSNLISQLDLVVTIGVTAAALVLLPLVLTSAAVLTTVAFVPITLSIIATTPLTVPMCWALACSGPAQERLWRPMVLWMAGRSWAVREVILLPLGVATGARTLAAEETSRGNWGTIGVDQGEKMTEASSRTCLERCGRGELSLLLQGRVRDPRADPDQLAGAAATLFFLACFENLMMVLSTGCHPFRWSPRRQSR
ncbi:unnamed protein product [Choristocarpus tenellus]